jgi:quinol monooxygenase YgiN
MATVLLYERHAVHPAQVDAFSRLAAELVDELRVQPGVLWADAARAFDDDPSFVFMSEWRTAADLDAWEATDAFGAQRDRVDVLVREDPTRRRFASDR